MRLRPDRQPNNQNLETKTSPRPFIALQLPHVLLWVQNQGDSRPPYFSMWAAWRETGDSIWAASLGNVTWWAFSRGVTIIARRYCRGPLGLS